MLAASLAAPAPAQLVTTAPPPGFADLDTPQPAVVDVWFDGEPVGLADALVRAAAIRFAEPAAVVDLLPVAVDRDAVIAALSGELDAHTERLCGRVPDPDCGRLEPEVAGVLFDLGSFRADVFVAPEHRDVGDLAARFLTLPPWAPSAVQAFSAAVSRVPDADTRAILGGRSVAAFGAGRAVADYGLDAEAGYFTDTLEAQLDRPNWRLEAGLDRATPVPVLGDRRFLGLRLASSLDLRRDRESARGSPLTVTLARRSQVEILRDGRLLGVQSLPAGTRTLDTSRLPTGAYEVTLRINSTAGTREETRFFVKSDALPPPGAPQLELEAGFFAEDAQAPWPELGTTPFVHGGVRHRLVDGLGVGLHLAATPDEAALGLRGDAFWHGVEVAADVFVGTDGAHGAALSARRTAGPVTVALGARHSFARARPGRIDGGDPDDPDDDVFVPDDLLESLTALADATTQLDLALAWRIAGGPRLGFRAFWRETRAGDPSYSFGPSVFWPLGRVGEARVDLFADAVATDDENFVLARLRVALPVGAWRLDGEAGHRSSDVGSEDDGVDASLAATRSWQTGPAGRLTLTGRAERTPGTSRLGAAIAARSRHGRLDVTADRALDAGETRLALTGGTSVAAAPGGLGLGGADAADSALVVRVDGTGDSVFEVLVDERARGEIRPGGGLVLPLRPYEAYRVRLRQSGGPVVAYDGTTRERTLLPGTVAAERWTVRPLVSVFARVVTPAGRPLRDATLETEPPYYTDGNGYLQADLPAGAPAVDVLAAGGRCRLVLPELVPSAAYQRLGDVPCHSL